jgi:hypothetical protein
VSILSLSGYSTLCGFVLPELNRTQVRHRRSSLQVPLLLERVMALWCLPLLPVLRLPHRCLPGLTRSMHSLQVGLR